MSAAGDVRPAARDPRESGPGGPDQGLHDDDVHAMPLGGGRDADAAPADPVRAPLAARGFDGRTREARRLRLR